MRLLLPFLFGKRLCSQNSATQTKGVLKIGSVSVNVKETERPELVPAGYASANEPQEMLKHLKWLLQKEKLGQDVFLIGAPGHIRSRVVLQYLELCNREFEWLSVNRDTTEADIKQRREIRGGSAFYSDLCAVRAALKGRVLVLDGVERAERNVLPILNNLLENREMQLDDGRFLMRHEAYDKLREKYSVDELKAMGVERVSERFHVVALGLPVPPYPGYTLDPPLRSRFQCTNVQNLNYQTVLSIFKAQASEVDTEKVTSLVSLAYAINSNEDLPLPQFPLDNLIKAANIWNANPSLESEEIFRMFYPINTILKEDQLKLVDTFLSKFGVKSQTSEHNGEILIAKQNSGFAEIEAQYNGKNVQFSVPIGNSQVKRSSKLVETSQQKHLLAQMASAHSNGDFGILGPKGCGKTAIVDEFARIFGYETETMVMYQDLNTRELLQRRRMLPNGDTIWEDSALVETAKKGGLCVLDGAERVHWSALEVLSPLVHNRHLFLPNGSRLVGNYEFEAIRKRLGITEEEMNTRGIWCIPPSFRLILTGDSERGDPMWLNDPILALMPFITHESLSIEEQIKVIMELAPATNEEKMRKLLQLVTKMRHSADAGLRGVAVSLSLRKLIHIARLESLHAGELRSNVEKAALARFLPSITRTAFKSLLDEASIFDDIKSEDEQSYQDDVNALRKPTTPGEETMVPDVTFYDNIEHLSIIRDMARDMSLGSHLLLIGNQGVGKNKITDRFLHLINRPRQYMQLHRDTTVESLTTQTTVEEGRLRHEDSALVKAVRKGHILVIDEADKAPLQVIAILKSLLDSGTLCLGDGRRIQPADCPSTERTIPLHPEFRMILLANRPGFPFLGNDLFGVLGDLLSVHTVDNPSRDSELEMLKRYAPDVSDASLNKLVSAFTELRYLAEEGIVKYPYSTRELVNIVKHANEYPDDPLPTVVKNVFDFDSFDSDTMKTIELAFQKHGIPLGVEQVKDNVFLTSRHSIPPFTTLGRWGINQDTVPLLLKQSIGQTQFKPEISLDVNSVKVEKQHMRSDQFTEQECAWQLDLGQDTSIVSDCISVDGSLVAVTVNPLGFYYVKDLENDTFAKRVDLSEGIVNPKRRGAFEPIVKVAIMDDGKFLAQEETTNQLCVVDTNKWTVQQLQPSQKLSDRVGNLFSRQDCHYRMVSGNRILLFERNGTNVILFGEDREKYIEAELPKSVEQIIHLSKNTWFVNWTDRDERAMILSLDEEKEQLSLLEISSSLPNDIRIHAISKDKKNRMILASEGFYCLKSDGFQMDGSEVSGSRCKLPEDPEELVDARLPYYVTEALPHVDASKNLVVMDGGVIVQPKGKWETPAHAISTGASPTMIGGFIEAVDTKSAMVQYIPVPEPRFHSYHAKWLHRISKVPFHIIPYKDDKMLTIDMSGGIRSFEVSATTLGKSYGEWQKMIEGGDNGPLRLEFNRSMEDFDLSKLDEPKVGKFDAENTPHMGGNQWMGGTGGYGTAGMGGVGGPFRVDAGHDVHQMPDMAKQQHILRKAREIGKAEYAKKLKEIEMSEYDDDSYQKLWKRISKESTHLKTIIEQLEAKKKERQWSRHQTSGDLDDGKLIEGMTGEKNIYRRRMEKLPEPGAPQVKPKRLRLCLDVSGSMYRFNGYDKRLQRSLEAALMIMTSLENQEEKVKYDLIGHSGDGPCTIFVKDKYPGNNKERLEILKKMIAHAQFCMSGDYTLEALDFSIRQLAKEEDADERIVVLVSDANMQRYGIRPTDIAKLLDKEKSVNSFVIFIGSLGDEAVRLQNSLPAGRAYVCRESAELPHIIKSIFASTLC